MDFIRDLMRLSEVEVYFTIWDVVFAVSVSFVLCMLVSWVYTKTYQGVSYSQSFVHTLVIMGVVISVIIVVIGSNIARAFSLAGALSIIRFRSAMRDPKDVAFVFFTMGVGLACGTGLYLAAAVFTVILCILIYITYALNYGGNKRIRRVLKITVPENLNYEGMFDDIFEEYLDDYSFVSVRTINLGTMFELKYIITNKKDVKDKTLIDEIRSRNGNLNVSILLEQFNETYY